jgi:type VI secretion system protein ImpH
MESSARGPSANIEDQKPSSDIKSDLVGQPEKYSFYQVVRLLRLLSGFIEKGADGSFLEKMLRIRPQLSFGFPGCDVYRLKEEKIEGTIQYRIEATFLGLYGVSSPLPNHYTEDLFAEVWADKSITRDFLDILNEPFYRHLFYAWSKIRWDVMVAEEQDDASLERLFCVLGLGSAELRQALAKVPELLRYVGLFSQYPRSAMGLQTLLSDAVPWPLISVTPCVKRRVEIMEELRCYVGLRNATVGEDCYLGVEMDDRMGKILVTADLLHAVMFNNLQPESSLFEKVETLTRLYLIEPLEVELELVLRSEEVRTVALGAPMWSHLGRDSWIFAGPEYKGRASVNVWLHRYQLGTSATSI